MAITSPISALKDLLTRLSLTQKAALLGSLGLLVAAVWGTVYYSTPTPVERPAETKPQAEKAPANDERGRLETELSSKIVQILEPIVGQGKVRPQVSVNVSVQHVEETTEQYDP